MSKLNRENAKNLQLNVEEQKIYINEPYHYFLEIKSKFWNLSKSNDEMKATLENEFTKLQKIIKNIEDGYSVARLQDGRVTLYSAMQLLVKTLLVADQLAQLEINLNKPFEFQQVLMQLKKLNPENEIEEHMKDLFRFFDRFGHLPVPTREKFDPREFNRLLGLKISPMSYSSNNINYVDNIRFTPLRFFFHDVNHISVYKNLKDRAFWKFVVKFADSLPPHERDLAHALIFRDTHEANDAPPSGSFQIPEFGVIRRNPLPSILHFVQRLQNENYWGFKSLEEIPNLTDALITVGQKLGDAVDSYLLSIDGS